MILERQKNNNGFNDDNINNSAVAIRPSSIDDTTAI